MAIYNGNTKVDLSGISKVYCGTQLVYQKGQHSTETVTFYFNSTLVSNITIYDYNPVNDTSTTIYSGTGYQTYTINYEIDKSHLIRFVKPSDNLYYIRYNNMSLYQFESTTNYYDIKVSDYTNLFIRLANSSDGLNRISLYIETTPSTIVIIKKSSIDSPEKLPNGIVAVNSYEFTSADLEPISDPGKTFDGWYFMSDNVEHQALEGLTVTENIVLYAKWLSPGTTLSVTYSRVGNALAPKTLGIDYKISGTTYTLLEEGKSNVSETTTTIPMPDELGILAGSGTAKCEIYLNDVYVADISHGYNHYWLTSDVLAGVTSVNISLATNAPGKNSTATITTA